MKAIVLVTGGRGGSDFFQGLLDKQEEILQIPAILRINKEFIEIFNSRNNREISEKFIRYVPLIFDSKKNKIERHDKLGPKRNKHYKVNKEKFSFYFEKISKKKTSKKISILENLFKAYYLASNKKISKLKLILLHTHTVDYTRKLFMHESINECVIVHTMRHPINALSSPITNWLKFNQGKVFFPKDLYFQKDLAINGLNDLVNLKKKIYVILLENLIHDKRRVMKDFCRIFNINFSESLTSCTYFGMQWWGDKVSGRWIGKKIGKQEKKFFDKSHGIFFDSDLFYFKGLTNHIINRYFSEKNTNSKNNFFYKLTPTKAEFLVWKNTFKHKKINHIISIPYFFIKRIFFLNSFFVKKFKLPYSIGTKKIK